MQGKKPQDITTQRVVCVGAGSAGMGVTGMIAAGASRWWSWSGRGVWRVGLESGNESSGIQSAQIRSFLGPSAEPPPPRPPHPAFASQFSSYWACSGLLFWLVLASWAKNRLTLKA